MNTGTTIALFAVTGLTLVVSTANLVVMLVGAKKIKAEGQKMQLEVESAKDRANSAFRQMRDALNNF